MRNRATLRQSFGSGGGDLRIELPVRGHDEVADAKLGFNNFVGRLRQAVEQMGIATYRPD